MWAGLSTAALFARPEPQSGKAARAGRPERVRKPESPAAAPKGCPTKAPHPCRPATRLLLSGRPRQGAHFHYALRILQGPEFSRYSARDCGGFAAPLAPSTIRTRAP